ncbi:MAG: DUF2087 domain-containing protein [Parvularculaceae bacterium]|nr:DUF2087 domain-containing protein [Parvularculaceae bacterium]
MTRTLVPFATDDVSSLARYLARAVDALGRTPTHVEMLNILARSQGARNFQHYRADRAAPAPRSPVVEEDGVNAVRVEAAIRLFDRDGVFLRWPSKSSLQKLAVWVLWSRLPAETTMSEKEIDAFLRERHAFGDHALLRRMLFGLGLVARTKDGAEYRRIEQKPPAEALAVIRGLAETSVR